MEAAAVRGIGPAWFSVSATRQQLEQNRRFQAGRVGFWADVTENNEAIVTIVNRSLDPVTDLDLNFVDYTVDNPDEGNEYNWIRVSLGTVPPCTRLIFPPDSFVSLLGMSHATNSDLWSVGRIQFYDSAIEVPGGADQPIPGLDVYHDPNVAQQPAEHCEV